MAKLATQDRQLNSQLPPVDWTDRKAWDRFLHANHNPGPFTVPTEIGAPGWPSVRFLDLVKARGGRIWFPGCGTDIAPRFYASIGCHVVATDFSPVAIKAQRAFAASPPERLFRNWSSVASYARGTFAVAEQDFTIAAPQGVFDAVLNCRAFQGLSNKAKHAAAKHFLAALRPGGVAIIDTMNVQGTHARNEIEDSLIAAGFYLPFNITERWYREQLDNTGVSYAMVLGRPRVQFNRNNSGKQPMAQWERDQSVLDSLTEEYKARQAEEGPSVQEICNNPETIVAHVVYPTG